MTSRANQEYRIRPHVLVPSATMEKTTSAVATQSSTSMSQSSASTANLPQVDGQVRVLNLSEYKQAALSLAEAFQDDEVAVYPINTPDRQGWSTKQKWDLHIHVMECLVRAHIMRGLVTCTGPNYDCIAMWSVFSSFSPHLKR